MNIRKSLRGRYNKSCTSFVSGCERWQPVALGLTRPENDDEESSIEEEDMDWEEQMFKNRRSLDDDIDQDQDVAVLLTKKQTLILSTLLPDEIILRQKFVSGEPQRFVGVLMMADVSGYTALSERYNSTGKSGTYRLTVTLNTYLGALIEIIYNHGGDILKFAGDAFLALWKTDKRSYLSHTIHTVITCALLIQQSYAKYETDVKVNLRVKLAISAGNLVFSPIGSGIDMNYVVVGLPVLEAKLAESVCASGEVKVSPTAWGHCYSRNYDYILHEDGHITIKSILYDPHENDVTKPYVGFGNMVRQTKKKIGTLENIPEYLWDSKENLSSADIAKRNDALSFRKSILSAEERNIGSEIRKFMIRPVLTQIDAHQPLEYLTEMRHITVLFLTLKPKECPPAQLITIVNNSYQITCEIVYKSMGCVNKIILFDKDIMTLVIFGLRGFKHESEAQAALKCAYSIKKSISSLDGVHEVSIGVTTGQVYCGVIGHPLRREFTVIGAVVNKAARLMCSFRNKISCDEATFAKSKMCSNGFTQLPTPELKGIAQVGKIYEYSEDIRSKELNNIQVILPLLNRSDEMKYFTTWIQESSNATYRDFDALLLLGESRIGKSRLLEWMARNATNEGFRICNINLTSVHTANPYLALTQIVNQILDIEEPTYGFEKEEKVVDVLKEYDDDLCYLNNVINVRFAFHEGNNPLDESKRIEKAKIVFTKFLKALPGKYVICLDDLQNLDIDSWDYISLMLNVSTFYTILTVASGKMREVHKWLYKVFSNNGVRKISLGPLSNDLTAPLACQILDVDAIPNDLCNSLRTSAKGIPGLAESFILHLFSTGAIELKKGTLEEMPELHEEEFQFPDPVLLHPQALCIKDQELLDEQLIENQTDEIKVCIVTNKEELQVNMNTQNLDAMIMVQIDALTPYQQLLLKIASVIGNTLSRDLLENIMYENSPLTTARAIKRLFAMRIFACANIEPRHRNRLSKGSIQSKGTNPHLSCECRIEYDPENSFNLPKYAFCKIMRFRNKNSRKTCYELLPMNQKKEFHLRIVNYLENNKQKCIQCGGAIMFLQSHLHVEDDESSATTQDNDNSNVSCNTTQVTTSGDSGRSMIKITKSLTTMASPSQISNLIKSNSEPLDTLENKIESIMKPTESGTYSSHKSTKRVTLTDIIISEDSTSLLENVKIYEMIRPVIEANAISDWQELDIVDSTDNIETTRRNSINKNMLYTVLAPGVSQTNFDKCMCAELYIIIYKELIHHAKQGEAFKSALEFEIRYSYLNYIAGNLEVVFDVLDEAEKTCFDKKTIDTILTSFERKRCLGQIYALRANAYVMGGQVVAAKMEIEKALRIYVQFSSTSMNMKDFAFLRKITSAIQYKSKETRAHERNLKADFAYCLNVATLLFSTIQDEKTARSCAFHALEIVQSTECRIVDTCDAITNAVQIEIDRGSAESAIEMENVAVTLLPQLPRPLLAEELYAAGKIFLATFRARLSRGYLAGAIRSGYKAITISHFIKAHHVTIKIVPDLFHVLICRRRFHEAVDVLKLVPRLPKSTCSEVWYYALCMDLILDAGFQVISATEITRYAEKILHSNKFGPGRRRLVINVWLYWIRVDTEPKGKPFESEALSWTGRHANDSTMTSLLSSLRLAEAMIECLLKKLDDIKKVVDMMELRSIADRELSRLEKVCRQTRATFPLWLLLRAHSYQLGGRSNLAVSGYNHVKEESRRIYNRMLEAHAKIALSGYSTWMPNARSNEFPSWLEAGILSRSDWHLYIYKMIIGVIPRRATVTSLR